MSLGTSLRGSSRFASARILHGQSLGHAALLEALHHAAASISPCEPNLCWCPFCSQSSWLPASYPHGLLQPCPCLGRMKVPLSPRPAGESRCPGSALSIAMVPIQVALTELCALPRCSSWGFTSATTVAQGSSCLHGVVPPRSTCSLLLESPPL